MNKLIPLVALALPLAASAQVTTLLNETFAADQRTTLNNPAGAQWFSSAGGSNVVQVDGTSLTQNTGGSGRHLLGYFTPAGAATALARQESLNLSFTVTFNRATPLNDQGNNFRFGLFDSTHGARMTADSHGGTNTTAPTPFDHYTGYAVMLNLGGADGTNTSIRERTVTTGQGLIGTVGAYTALGSNGPSFTLAPNTAYSGSLSFTRTQNDELDIAFALEGDLITGFSLALTDDSPSFDFDTVVFQMGSGAADGFTLSQVKIDHSAIPEPSTTAALMGAGILGLALLRRRPHNA